MQSLFPLEKTDFQFGISVTSDISNLLGKGSPVAICVSGGKDSQAAAIRTFEYLDSVAHGGPQILIHSDLGTVEWKDSLPTCERLARRLDIDLVIVRRKAGDMMARWEKRWENNVARYSDLSCVKLILPWSTPSMRFCTSELKSAVISAELLRRFPGQSIVSVSGIRHEESSPRSRMPIARIQPRISRKNVSGWDWHPIIGWSAEEVFEYLDRKNERLHEAYRVYGSSRVSCAFCIMGAIDDLKAASSCPENQEIYRAMVDLELRSTFAFQGGRWLGDVAPHLLSSETRTHLPAAKNAAEVRARAEARIPRHLLFVDGIPTRVPTRQEAALLSGVRKEVSSAVGIRIGYTDPDSIIERYRLLYQERTCSDLRENMEGGA